MIMMVEIVHRNMAFCATGRMNIENVAETRQQILYTKLIASLERSVLIPSSL
jgi:hypothetical protein